MVQFDKSLELKIEGSGTLTTRHPFLKQQWEQLPILAKSNYPVLILGPSGTGKEVLADAIHRLSCRKQGPLVKVNCSALSETLVESELFGHVKGAFTGAISDRRGAFESARGGTLFLDEIGDLPYTLQAKLLRAIENQEIRPVGSDRVIRTDVRIVAATHENLLEKVQKGQFRLDLFYRLNVISLRTLPLKERLEDFEAIVFELCREYRVRFHPEAIELLKLYPWPGNIRELKNLIIRASILYPHQLISPDWTRQLLENQHLLMPTQKLNPLQRLPKLDNNQPPMENLKHLEKEVVLYYLRLNRGNQRATAKVLGIPKSTLHDRLKSWGINPRDFRWCVSNTATSLE